MLRALRDEELTSTRDLRGNTWTVLGVLLYAITHLSEHLGHLELTRQLYLDGAGEARLVALACGSPPPGFAQWTGPLLAEALVAEGVVETISATTVNVTLKKTR